MRLDNQPGVLVVRHAGQTLEDAANVEVLAGTVTNPGERIAAGILLDPLGGVHREMTGVRADNPSHE